MILSNWGNRGSGPFAPMRSTSSYLAQSSHLDSYYPSSGEYQHKQTHPYYSNLNLDGKNDNDKHRHQHRKNGHNNYNNNSWNTFNRQCCVNAWQVSQASRSFKEQFWYFDCGGKGCKEADLPSPQDPLGPWLLSGSLNYRQSCLDPSGSFPEKW